MGGKNLQTPNYSENKHRDLCDKHKYGITQYGIHLKDFPSDKIQYNTFHSRKADAVKTMEYLKKKYWEKIVTTE